MRAPEARAAEAATTIELQPARRHSAVTKDVATRVTNKSIHAYLSQEAREAFDDFGMEHGVSFSGLVEGLGRAIIAGEDLTVIVRLGRRVDAERRRR
jgi:hypothetical protein